MYKIFESVLFIILNIILTPFFILLFFLLLTMKFYDYTNTDTCFYVYSFIILLFRILVFPFLYLNGQKLQNIKNLFDKIIVKNKLLFITILFAFFCDCLSVFLTTDKNIIYSFNRYIFALKYDYIYSGGGLFVSYLSFLIWLKYIKPKWKINIKIFNIIFLLLFILFIIPIIIILHDIFVV